VIVRHHRAIKPIAIAIAAVTAVMLTGTAASASSFPVNWDTSSALASGIWNNVPPAGANDPSCRSSAHPDPVILLHGVLEDQNMVGQAISPTLANSGYCVYTMNYGEVWYSGNIGGIDYVENSANEVASFVNTVLSWTGASKVDFIGYSEAGYIARLYMKNYGSTHVGRYVGIAPVNMRPPSFLGLETIANMIPGARQVLAFGCPACGELSQQSYFDSLNNPATFPNVMYTDIASSSDEVASPYTLSFLPAAANVTNITVQDLCPSDQVGHLGVPYDQTVVALIMNALDPSNPVSIPCVPGFPF
jgi:triacylglycerol esterase/lipase EstA (alpha/beta hydrolase family)